MGRYDSVRDKNGETRREYNARFGQDSPEIPDVEPYGYILGWMQSLGASRQWTDGTPRPVSYTETVNWLALTGTLITRSELKILRDVDEQWCAAVCTEKSDIAARESKRS